MGSWVQSPGWEFEIGFLTVGNSYRNGRRERLSSSQAMIYQWTSLRLCSGKGNCHTVLRSLIKGETKCWNVIAQLLAQWWCNHRSIARGHGFESRREHIISRMFCDNIFLHYSPSSYRRYRFWYFVGLGQPLGSSVM
jgi:hypothetical protein